jgi:hypothetical protein
MGVGALCNSHLLHVGSQDGRRYAEHPVRTLMAGLWTPEIENPRSTMELPDYRVATDLQEISGLCNREQTLTFKVMFGYGYFGRGVHKKRLSHTKQPRLHRAAFRPLKCVQPAASVSHYKALRSKSQTHVYDKLLAHSYKAVFPLHQLQSTRLLSATSDCHCFALAGCDSGVFCVFCVC